MRNKDAACSCDVCKSSPVQKMYSTVLAIRILIDRTSTRVVKLAICEFVIGQYWFVFGVGVGKKQRVTFKHAFLPESLVL